MTFLRNKFVKIMLSVIIIVSLLSVLAYAGNNPVSRMLYSVMSPIYSCAYNAVTPVRKAVKAVSMSTEYETQINNLKQQINTLRIENKSRKDYIEENKRLKELLDLRDNLTDYKTVTARVVSYEPDSWFDTVMLNKGSSSGIEQGDTVITALGVVGKVIDVGKNWARVSTLLDISNSLGIKLSRTGDIGVVSGDASLAQDKNCRLEFLSNDKNLIRGDMLVTSGLGGIYPPDLTVGRVAEIKSDSAGNLEYGIIEPSVDFSALYEVLVITYYDVDDTNNSVGQGAE